MTGSTAGAAPPTGDDDVKRRVRFDAEADLRLLQAVVKREPFAADHGTKLKAWDDVAEEVYTTAAKLRDVPSSRRAVTDRFHHLLLRFEQGTLKIKRWTDTPNGEEKAALVVNLFRLITARMADIRTKRAKRAATSTSAASGGRSSTSSLVELATESQRKRSGASSVEVDGNDDDDDDDDDDDGGKTEDELNDGTASATASADGGSSTAQGADSGNAHPSARSKSSACAKRSHADAGFHAELLALKREKLELKRQKLALLQTHHVERMALERQRLELAAQQLAQTKLAAAPSPSTATETSTSL